MLSDVSSAVIDERPGDPESVADTSLDPEVEPRTPGLVMDEDDQPRALWERAIGWVIVGICTFIVFSILTPGHNWSLTHLAFGDLFRNTTTNGGDMGAHVWMPWFLEKHWFGQGRLSGWAPDWYAGFPVGMYYFPLPNLMVAFLDLFLHYNIAFKLVTVSGPLMLPAAAYSFAKGMRAPWPAPPAFAIAALGMLVEERNSWNIYGGNIASTLAGEYSFEIALAFALFALGALAYTLDTGRRPWLPAVLIAAAVMSHIVVAIFVGVAAVLLWLVRRPRRTWPIAVSVGTVGLALTAVWSLPLVAGQAMTQSMRYGKVISGGSSWSVPHWLFLPNPVKNTIAGLVRGVSVNRDSSGTVVAPTLWLPWWIWVLSGVAIVAAGWYRRRSTFVLVLVALSFGIFFVQWPEHAVWNTRFLPFWLLAWGLVAAMGATEIVRLVAYTGTWAFSWIRDGDLQDARAKAWADLAVNDSPEVDPALRHEAVAMLASRRFRSGPPGWEPEPHLAPELLARRARVISTVVLAALVAISGVFGLHRAWDARRGNSAIAIEGWAAYNYRGYEKQDAWPEYDALMKKMGSLPPGRALWEGGDAVGAYGTTLALELLPYFTNGRIGSMEGLYFESSATTSFHFITVSELSAQPSNPVSGLVYGSSTNASDFSLGVKHLQMLGVRYLMLFTPQTESMAKRQPDLELIATVPDMDGKPPKGWKIYRVKDALPLVSGLSVEPLVAKTHAGNYQQCWGEKWNQASPMPQLGAWECSAAPWFTKRAQLDKVWVASGPASWKHIDIKQLDGTSETSITPTKVTRIREDVDSISFHVSEIGKPVLVKTSYFPNWNVHGASGPYRAAPNLMVVVPTSHDVKLTYGLTGVDWLGRVITLIAVAALGALITWKGMRRFGAAGPSGEDDERGGHDAEPEPVAVSATGSELEDAPFAGGVPPPGPD
ncbi:MAG: hypothetical protein QOG50_3579 [Actinomycetota bacterium]|nr:hypothetical protein [Actinomycetota bacterium]